MNDIQIENFVIGKNHQPFLIAEMSGNHNQSLERAFEIVDAAAESGAHALKLQTYTPDTMTIPGAFKIEDKNSLWNGRELYELYEEAYTPWDWHAPIFERAKEKGMIPFSTPFDETAVDFLEELNVPLYKVASFENTDLPLLKKVASTGKPIIMSTGAATLQDISEAVSTIREAGCEDLILLKCTSTYPATPDNSNIVTIPHLSETFNCLTGLSDHTHGIGVAIASIALGASVIEKHFTLDRNDGGVDSDFSMEPKEFLALSQESTRAFQGLGKIQYNVQKAEEKSLMFKRSVFIVKDIKKGENFTSENLKVIRPGIGLPPKYYDQLLGRASKKDFQKGNPLQLDDIL